MRILIIGGNGMVGHVLLRELSDGHETRGTFRHGRAGYGEPAFGGAEQHYYGVEVRSIDQVRSVLQDFAPDLVVNAAGIIKQHADVNEPALNVQVNALFPHQLAELTGSAGSHLIHISTDCVFSGRRGSYSEDDVPDPIDAYGQAKLLGEPSGPGTLTLRVSLIGLELDRRLGLIEWALAQRESFSGYRRVRFNGLTTKEFARAVQQVIGTEPWLAGTWHVSSEPISKYELLVRLFELLGRPVEITVDDTNVLDRTLRSERFRAKTGWAPAPWETMLFELAHEVQDRESHTHAL